MKDSSPNDLLLGRDCGPHKKAETPWWRQSHGNGKPGLETISISTIDAGSSKKKSSGGMTSANYQKVYQQEQAQKQEEQKRQAQGAKPSASSQNSQRQDNEKTQRDTDEKRKEDEYRQRARQLQDQIVYWEGQKGQGAYDETIIANSIDDLKRQLGNIPQQYWN
jgi:hypothetical protein